MAFQIESYEKENRECPFDDFLADLSPKMKAKVLRDLDLLEEFGNRLREPYSKHLEDGIFELRTQLASDITRSLYFFYEGDRIIITHGFTKKQMKTPPGEIQRAKEYRADWIRRYGK
ncbi:MAG: type II toxin-antitoxin system RelE/ParE family toxin [Oscillospiraceae bacterium]|nr:type II toxin-antitoxin system RelE/ParE family toxin [Oscillospiraceae bacterium]